MGEEGRKGIKLAKVYHYDLYGLRNDKYEFLSTHLIDNTKWEQITTAPLHYLFKPVSIDNKIKTVDSFSIKELFIINSLGIITKRDDLTIAYNSKTLKKKLLFIDDKISTLDACKKYKIPIKDNDKWNAEISRKSILPEQIDREIKDIIYRPFDIRKVFYNEYYVARMNRKVLHNLNGKNYGLISGRQGQAVGDKWNIIYITKYLSDQNIFRRGGGTVFPLYLYEGKKRRPNFAPKIINEIEQKLNLTFSPEDKEQQPPCNSVNSSVPSVVNSSVRVGSCGSWLNKKSFTPLDLFDYIYAVLHSPAYRETYREFLKIDFPRIPYPADAKTFWKLAALGGTLRRLYLLEGSEFEKIDAASVPSEKIRYSEGRVFVNDDFCFKEVSQTAWEFYIGGYQPAQKWLKDRKGCILKAEDFRHYRKIVLALTETARIMGEIDGGEER